MPSAFAACKELTMPPLDETWQPKNRSLTGALAYADFAGAEAFFVDFSARGPETRSFREILFFFNVAANPILSIVRSTRVETLILT